MHVRCEGIVVTEPNEEMAQNYLCSTCEKGMGNKSWIMEKLTDAKLHFTSKSVKLEKEITEKEMNIEKLKNQDSKCGPRQNRLKESAKKLNINPAKYHGGASEGKSVQSMFKCARDKSFSILNCIDDKQEEKAKFQRALTNLQQVSDILKNPKLRRFDEEQLEKVQIICEKWGTDWPKDFPHLNLTPKGHVLSFVLPKILEEHKTFHKFYAMEELGESIHAALNDREEDLVCIYFVH